MSESLNVKRLIRMGVAPRAAERFGAVTTRDDWSHTIDLLDDLPDAVRRERIATGKSIRGAAREIGISFSTLDRFERRQVGVQLKPVRLMLKWLSREPALTTKEN